MALKSYFWPRSETNSASWSPTSARVRQSGASARDVTSLYEDALGKITDVIVSDSAPTRERAAVTGLPRGDPPGRRAYRRDRRPDTNDSIVSATVAKGSPAPMISRRRRAASIR